MNITAIVLTAILSPILSTNAIAVYAPIQDPSHLRLVLRGQGQGHLSWSTVCYTDGGPTGESGERFGELPMVVRLRDFGASSCEVTGFRHGGRRILILGSTSS